MERGSFSVGCGPITWGDAPEEQILAEIAQAGYEGAPFRLRGERSPEDTIRLFERYGLRPAPGYLGASFWIKGEEARALEEARRYAAFTRRVGCTELYVAASGTYTTARGLSRRQVSGHVRPEDAMSAAEFRQFADTLNKVAEITLSEGVRSCFHNHVGTVIETRDEVDRLFSLVDRQRVFLGLDTGHLAWGGADVVRFCRDYAESLKTLHLKDINPQVMAQGRRGEWDYQTQKDHGIFAELGEGFLDFVGIIGVLRDVGFAGWLIVETDVTQKATPLESAIISRRYLSSIGI